MTSTFAWLDYSARERRAMLEVVDLFRERNTVDELGLGVVRDAFANALFPGTSTLHSRTRYWLFVPWIHLQLERDRTSSAKAEERARQLQAALVRALEAGGEQEGVIGIEARDKVLRPPSILYWAGLERHGLRLFPGSINRYHASLDAFYRARAARRSEGDDTELIDPGRRNWHPAIPPAPVDLFTRSDFKLSRPEAGYLRERFMTSAPDSYLAWGLQRPTRLTKIEYPWDHPHLAAAPPMVQEVVEAGRRFALLMHGAVVIYNLAMAEKAHTTGLRDEALADEYRSMYGTWAENRIGPELEVLRAWDREAFWGLVASLTPGWVQPVRAFSDTFIARVLAEPATALGDPEIRTLIARREQRMKGALARLQNQRALERWNGRSGLGELSYRWAQGRTLLQDIAEGMRMAGDDA